MPAVERMGRRGEDRTPARAAAPAASARVVTSSARSSGQPRADPGRRLQLGHGDLGVQEPGLTRPSTSFLPASAEASSPGGARHARVRCGCEIPHHRSQPPQPPRRGHQQFIARHCRRKPTPPRPRRGTAERVIQQRGISIDQRPVLPAPDDRREEAEHAAGAAGEIHEVAAAQAADRPAAARASSNVPRDRTARAVRASGSEPLGHTVKAWANSRTWCSPVRQAFPTCQAASAITRRRLYRRSAAQCLRQIDVITVRADDSGLRGYQFSCGSAIAHRDRQARFNASAIAIP